MISFTKLRIRDRKAFNSGAWGALGSRGLLLGRSGHWAELKDTEVLAKSRWMGPGRAVERVRAGKEHKFSKGMKEFLCVWSRASKWKDKQWSLRSGEQVWGCSSSVEHVLNRHEVQSPKPKVNKSPGWSVCQYLWCEHFYHIWFQAAYASSEAMELGRDM